MKNTRLIIEVIVGILALFAAIFFTIMLIKHEHSWSIHNYRCKIDITFLVISIVTFIGSTVAIILNRLKK